MTGGGEAVPYREQSRYPLWWSAVISFAIAGPLLSMALQPAFVAGKITAPMLTAAVQTVSGRLGLAAGLCGVIFVAIVLRPRPKGAFGEEPNSRPRLTLLACGLCLGGAMTVANWLAPPKAVDTPSQKAIPEDPTSPQSPLAPGQVEGGGDEPDNRRPDQGQAPVPTQPLAGGSRSPPSEPAPDTTPPAPPSDQIRTLVVRPPPPQRYASPTFWLEAVSLENNTFAALPPFMGRAAPKAMEDWGMWRGIPIRTSSTSVVFRCPPNATLAETECRPADYISGGVSAEPAYIERLNRIYVRIGSPQGVPPAASN